MSRELSRDKANHDKLLNLREHKEIYLAINTNINCVENWCPKYDDYVLPNKTGIYLGKIIFQKNTVGNLAPLYIPSSLENLGNEVSKLTTLWLNEKNDKYIGKRKVDYKIVEIYNGNIKSIDLVEIKEPFTPNHIPIFCERTKKNIVLTKEQIVSYFKYLHNLNANLIKNYIDSINEYGGIKGYYLNDIIRQEAADKKLIKYEKTITYSTQDPDQRRLEQEQFWENYKQESIITLDYMKTQNIDNNIPFFSELFYAYLVWSLKDFLVTYYQGVLVDRNNLLFNIAAYKGYNIDDFFNKDIEFDRMLYTDCYRFVYRPTDFFNIVPTHYFVSGEKGNWFGNQPSFYSLNQFVKDPFGNYDMDYNQPTFSPSPLGNYYFELKENKNTFVEFYPRIYPSKANPPQGWSKEMMDKLDLRPE
ncbi:hypothetical protein DCO58_05200 [Helicobacter saguini]|uniref:Uncharacterized protein n=1 Tax=Helicobacter saguini TaxID=1548018 RepID=A0A347VT36_9HELI|nr:hypothetical protein [Helicobacter saguini]MWV62254.1 hypothetical protein [Helicobacter saguini]MWV67073.1 hypothetical protein [Helicobacter saguini]MWV69423.1 hypothetical protein [Helicobacter saguini]MWV71023.1 hypothetical protein [Helicobacter saguini]TLD95071.1 hypothetical protein LS64_003960 [Helicobacter saguini]